MVSPMGLGGAGQPLLATPFGAIRQPGEQASNRAPINARTELGMTAPEFKVAKTIHSLLSAFSRESLNCFHTSERRDPCSLATDARSQAAEDETGRSPGPK